MQHATAAQARQVAANVSRRADEIYRNYRLIGGSKGERFAAVAYAGKRQVFSAGGDDIDETLDALKRLIDDDFDNRAERRGHAGPSADDFELALDLASPKHTSVQRHVIEQIASHGDNPLSLLQMRRRSDFSEEALLRALARTAKVAAEMMQLKVPSGPSSAEAALELIALEAHANADPENFWTFRPEFVSAAARHIAR